MNAVDLHSQFKYEFIAGVSLSNNAQRSKQTQSNAETHKEHQTTTANKHYHSPHHIPSVPITQQPGKEQLRIVGLELNPKVTSNGTDQASSVKSTSSLDSKAKSIKLDQTVLQFTRRATFMGSRKIAENLLIRRLAQIPLSSPDKLNMVSLNNKTNLSTQCSDDKLNMAQQTQSNPPLISTIKILKKMPSTQDELSSRSMKQKHHSFVTVGRDTTSLKLPTLIKRTPATLFKSTPTAYIQDSSHLQINSSAHTSRPILQPTPILPVYAPHRSVTLFTDEKHLPIIKDRMIKANLAQRANFKCKSPPPCRPDSSLSRSTTAVITASQCNIKTYTPLKHADVGTLLTEATRNKLKRLFQQLDTDRDGHLTYPQVQQCLPSNLRRAQETFFRVLYDITSVSTYFGLQEFFAMAVIVDTISKQDSELWNSLLDDVDFNYYRDDILDLLDEFDDRYSPITSTVNLEDLVGLIMSRTTTSKYERVAQELERRIPMAKTLKFTRLEFVALIPLIIYVESCLNHGKPLFRFRENSMLDAHMQKTVLI